MFDVLPDDVRAAAEDELPASMLEAQRSIATPEVQGLIRELAKHNLGVCMPHMHVTGDFREQPADIIQVEARSDFLPADEVAALGTLPVAWRWHDDQVIVSGSCHIRQVKCDG
jgi:hypothetical protein